MEISLGGFLAKAGKEKRHSSCFPARRDMRGLEDGHNILKAAD
jgi:hypothetical protein